MILPRRKIDNSIPLNAVLTVLGEVFRTQLNIYDGTFLQKSSIVDFRLSSKCICGSSLMNI